MKITYNMIERFMLDYFPAYSEKAQLPETQSAMDRFYAPDISFDRGLSGRDVWYRACLSHPSFQDLITVERLCIDERKLTVSAQVRAHFIERGTGSLLHEIGMNAFYTLIADNDGELRIARIDVYLESDPAKAARMMEVLRIRTVRGI